MNRFGRCSPGRARRSGRTQWLRACSSLGATLALAAIAEPAASAPAAQAAEAAQAAGPAEVQIPRPLPVLQAPPDELGPEDIERYWQIATGIERRALTEEAGRSPIELSMELEHASSLFERAARAPEGRPEGYWRAARAIWLSGEVLPLESKDEKLERFRSADRLADVALERNPDCGECMLWKFIAMGRVATTAGMMDAMRALPEMAALLERGIELQPTHRDSDDNSTVGNLHYSSAIFYRIVPDWIVLKWMTGVRGDKQRALAESRKALALHPNRLDYRIEVGTQLLCLGTSKKKPDLLAEGQRVLHEAIALTPATEDERREIYFAHRLLEEPKKACGYTGDQFVDVEEDERRRKESEAQEGRETREKRDMKQGTKKER